MEMTQGMASLEPGLKAKLPQLQESFDILSEEVGQLEVLTDDILARLVPVCNPVTLEDSPNLTTEQARPMAPENIAVIRKARIAENMDNIRERVGFLTQRIRVFRDALEI